MVTVTRPAVVLGDFRFDEIAAQRFQAFERAFFAAPISREYPATSAGRIAARRRVWLMSPRRQQAADPTGKARAARCFADSWRPVSRRR